MKTKAITLMSVLIGVGAVLHAVIPPLVFGMKPDLMITMMFLSILLFPKVQYVFITSIATAIISALTTGFPGGQIANMIDKPVTAFILLGLFLMAPSFFKSNLGAAIFTAVGTIISGVIFLTIALLFAGLPSGTGFLALLLTVVLPASILNTIMMVIIY
ncbi:MAG TPA: tryptophan transporter, partial [Massilibacterium sp.]|nr:tryptophan transporter [Massilibacterium sp.]